MGPRRAALSLVVSAVAVAGCSSANVGKIVTAVAVTAVNVAAAAIQHEVNGDCYSQCSYGTRCNHSTGMCEPDEERRGAAPVLDDEELLLDERCADTQREWNDGVARGYGSNHPHMTRLRTVLEKCEEVRSDPGSPEEMCGLYALDLADLEGSGLGSEHPKVIRAETALEECLSEYAPHAAAP